MKFQLNVAYPATPVLPNPPPPHNTAPLPPAMIPIQTPSSPSQQLSPHLSSPTLTSPASSHVSSDSTYHHHHTDPLHSPTQYHALLLNGHTTLSSSGHTLGHVPHTSYSTSLGQSHVPLPTSVINPYDSYVQAHIHSQFAPHPIQVHHVGALPHPQSNLRPPPMLAHEPMVAAE